MSAIAEFDFNKTVSLGLLCSAERVITVCEAGRLQSVPDYVCPQGTLAEKYRMIGNAVPPLLAKGILEKLQ